MSERKYFLILAFFIFLVFYPVLFLYFAQDDFFHFYISRAANFHQLLDFFKPRNDVIFFRPLSVQIYTFLNHRLFGLNPFFYHLEALLLHLINAVLVFFLTKLIFNRKAMAFFASFFYALNNFHFLSLSWIAEFSTILGPFFSFLSLIYFLKHPKIGTRKFLGLSLVFFLLALLSSELSIVLPILLLLALFIKDGTKAIRKPILIWLLIFFGVSFSYLILRFLLFGLTPSKFYQFQLNPILIFNSYKWYLLRTLSLPEGILNLKAFIPLISLFVLFSLLILLKFLLDFKKIDFRIFGICSLFFLTGLLPIIFIPQHASSLYLSLASLGILWPLSLIATQGNLRPSFSFLLVTIFFINSYFGMRRTFENHWIIKRSNLAKINLLNLKENYPNLLSDSTIYFQNEKTHDSLNLYLSMVGALGVRALYDDYSLKIYFEDLDSVPIPENLIKIKVIDPG